jgi:hypothetical protein
MTEAKARYVAAVVIGLLALALRWRAVLMLPVDYDEPVYLEAASQFASAIQARDWPRLLDNRHTLEHPPLVKLLYAVGTLVHGEGFAQLATTRTISLLFGTLQVALLAVVSPIAGSFLAVHTMSIKYTSQAYLEALPAFTSLLAVVAFQRSKPQRGRPDRWLILSAVALGVTAAAKYTYLVTALVLVSVLVWRHRQRLQLVALFLAIALVTFLMLDFQIWVDPLGRLLDSLLFHPAYSQSRHVVSQNLPWWQQLHYLSRSIPWHPGVFLFSWDTAIFALALLGLPWLYRRHPLYAAWWLLGMIVLLIWPTRWPQYTLIIAAPLCLSAGTLLTAGTEWLDENTSLVRGLRALAPNQGFWLFGGILVAAGLIAVSYVQWQYAQQMQGWTTYVTRNSGLPSDSVRALALDADGSVWAGTERGAARFEAGGWQVYSTSNSGLIDNMVRAVAVDGSGRVWFGTDSGLSILDGNRWLHYDAENSGLLDNQILCITPVPTVTPAGESPGPIWFGTERGASFFSQGEWSSYTPKTSGLPGGRVLSIAIDDHGHAWFGTWGGLAMFDGQAWTTYTTENSPLVYDTVASLVIDEQGHIWCGTLDGVSVFDGHSWQTHSILSMSLRFNTATAMAIDHLGQIWVGADLPVGPIGAAAMFDGQQWHDYSSYFSGFRRAPLRAIAVDPENRIWFGTLLEGVSVYEGFTIDPDSSKGS